VFRFLLKSALQNSVGSDSVHLMIKNK